MITSGFGLAAISNQAQAPPAVSATNKMAIRSISRSSLNLGTVASEHARHPRCLWQDQKCTRRDCDSIRNLVLKGVQSYDPRNFDEEDRQRHCSKHKNAEGQKASKNCSTD